MRAICAGGMALLTLLTLLAAVLVCAFDANTYARDSRAALSPMDENEKTAYIGMDAQEQEACARRIVAYFRGAVLDINIRLASGEAAFNAKECSHMADVRALLSLAGWVALGLAGALALLGVAYGCVGRGMPSWEAARATRRGMLLGLGFLAAGTLCLAGWAAMDFRGVFEQFHRLVFTNEDWLLDPRTDRLIRMMPQRLFETLSVRVLCAGAAIPLLTLTGVCLWARCAQKRQAGARR